MSAIVSVIVDNYVLATSLVALVVSLFALMLWRRKPQTDGGETVADEFLVDDSLPRSKKTVKSKPKKSKSEKVLR